MVEYGLKRINMSIRAPSCISNFSFELHVAFWMLKLVRAPGTVSLLFLKLLHGILKSATIFGFQSPLSESAWQMLQPFPNAPRFDALSDACGVPQIVPLGPCWAPVESTQDVEGRIKLEETHVQNP